MAACNQWRRGKPAANTASRTAHGAAHTPRGVRYHHPDPLPPRTGGASHALTLSLRLHLPAHGISSGDIMCGGGGDDIIGGVDHHAHMPAYLCHYDSIIIMAAA